MITPLEFFEIIRTGQRYYERIRGPYNFTALRGVFEIFDG